MAKDSVSGVERDEKRRRYIGKTPYFCVWRTKGSMCKCHSSC